jgi:hypothetical protein
MFPAVRPEPVPSEEMGTGTGLVLKISKFAAVRPEPVPSEEMGTGTGLVLKISKFAAVRPEPVPISSAGPLFWLDTGEFSGNQ